MMARLQRRSDTMQWILLALTLFTMPGADAQSVLEPAAQRGQVIARTSCARCHSIDRVTDSPLAIAPPFRTLHKKYPVENLEEAMAEGISTGHPTMPEFRFDPGQISDFIAFLKSLER
jgi:mono/diheme cytochrome c family protein